MAKKDNKTKLDNVLGTVKKGKELWDAHGTELVEAVKKAIPKKGKKMSVRSIIDVVKAGRDAWNDSGKEVATEAATLFSTADSNTKEVGEEFVEKPEYLPETVYDSDKEETDTFFEDKLDSMWDTAKNTDPKNPQEVKEALDALARLALETVQYVAEQETKQEEIRAKRDVAIAQINATSACIKEYLDKTFDERSAIFAKQFECMDAALREGNTEMLAMTLNSINSLAASSPFKNLADINQVQEALSGGDTEWDI